MPVLTEKEFARNPDLESGQIEESSFKSVKDGSGEPCPSLIEVEAGFKPASTNGKKVQAFRWTFFHPENGTDSLIEYEDSIEIDGKVFKRKFVRGILKTTDKTLADFLLKKKYILVDKVKVDGSPNST